MKTVGIIAEYNPFHNGHAYQIRQARALTGADFVAVAMSGDFVQRGEPAVFDKYTRTRMALSCGADLVLELPFAFATGSAEDFASCGVALLDKLGCVDALCFGSESGRLEPLKAAADILVEEPDSFRESLKERLRLGDSYPAARSRALEAELPCQADGQPEALASPNNILGVEYLKAIKRRRSTIRPVTLRRAGQDYNDGSMPQTGMYASASALRQMLRQGHDLDSLAGQVPASALSALKEEGAAAFPVFPDDLSELLTARLLELACAASGTESPAGLFSRYSGMSPELASRLGRSLLDFDSFSRRVGQLKTRGYTYTRVSRALLHLLLSVTDTDMAAYRDMDYAPYGRVIGFRTGAGPLLSAIKASASIPLVTKTADAGRLLSPGAYGLLRKDFHASHLYQSILAQKGRPMKNEYTRSVVIVP